MSLQCAASQDGGGDSSSHRESSGGVNEETCLDELAREVGMERLVAEPDVGEEWWGKPPETHLEQDEHQIWGGCG